jgi:hypothetical protein
MTGPHDRASWRRPTAADDLGGSRRRTHTNYSEVMAMDERSLLDTPHTASIFLHLRVVIAIVVGLSITRLLSGLAQLIQHPRTSRVYPTHLGWVLTMLLMVVHFWWWEFRLTEVEHWSFQLYFFIIFYAVLFFLLCALLFPDSTSEYSGFESYFFSRRKWFFGILALNFCTDVVDTIVKGATHFRALGPEYPVRTVVLVVLCVVAMYVRNRAFHLAFVVSTFAYQLSWVIRDLDPIVCP